MALHFELYRRLLTPDLKESGKRNKRENTGSHFWLEIHPALFLLKITSLVIRALLSLDGKIKDSPVLCFVVCLFVFLIHTSYDGPSYVKSTVWSQPKMWHYFKLFFKLTVLQSSIDLWWKYGLLLFFRFHDSLEDIILVCLFVSHSNK